MDFKKWIGWIGFNSFTFLILGVILLASFTTIAIVSYTSDNQAPEAGNLLVPGNTASENHTTTETSDDNTNVNFNVGGSSGGGGGGGSHGGGSSSSSGGNDNGGSTNNAPSVSLNYPGNFNATKEREINFSYTASDNPADDLAYCELWGNFNGTYARNQTNSTIVSGVESQFTLSNLSDGIYNWSILCADKGSNFVWSENRTFIIDNIKPQVIVYQPKGTFTSLEIPLNISYSDNNGVILCNYNVYNTSGVKVVGGSIAGCQNRTIPGSDGTLSNGTYSINVTIYDAALNQGSNVSSFILNMTNSSDSQFSPNMICTPQDLNNVRNNLSGSYVQTCDIDLSGFNWVAINQFNGTYDGQGHNIGNLYGNNSLFGTTTINANLINITLNNFTLYGKPNDPNGYNVGLLVGSLNGKITNIAVYNSRINASFQFGGQIGGVVGEANKASIKNIYVKNLEFAPYLNYDVGGVVGRSLGMTTIDNVTVENISVNSPIYQFGGVVGQAIETNISKSKVSGSIISQDEAYDVGGVVGVGQGVVIDDAYFNGQIKTNYSNEVGGVVGRLLGYENSNSSSKILNSVFNGTISNLSANMFSVGGVVGKIDISGSTSLSSYNVTLYNISSSGDVAGEGGVIGEVIGSGNGVSAAKRHYVFVDSIYSSTKVAFNIGLSTAPVGGVVGQAIGPAIVVSNVSFNGTVKGYGSVGGVIGRITTDIISGNFDRIYSYGNVTGDRDVGGVVGQAIGNATISRALFAGTINGRVQVGGIIGSSSVATSLDKTYSSGTVNGTGPVGGIAGDFSEGIINNSYSLGKVSGQDYVGGVVGVGSTGSSSPAILNSYSATQLTSQGVSGGLVASTGNGNFVGSSYWDTQVTGQAFSSGGGTGKTTVQMKTQSTFSGWDFTNVWEILPSSYPSFRWQTGNCGPLGCSPQGLFNNNLIIILTIHIIAIFVCAILYFYLHHKEHDIHQII